MSHASPLDLGRRERQIMEIVYASGKASVGDVLAALPDPPSYSAVRAVLNTLEDKGHLKRQKDGKRFIYLPTLAREKARGSVMKRMLETFFNNSAAQAMASLIETEKHQLTDDDLDQLQALIDSARREGR